MKKISDGKKCMICLALVLIMGFLLFYTYTGDGRKNEHEGIIRLHVIANSDTVGDQALKLKVRDAVIEYLQKQDDLHTVDSTLRDRPGRYAVGYRETIPHRHRVHRSSQRPGRRSAAERRHKTARSPLTPHFTVICRALASFAKKLP